MVQTQDIAWPVSWRGTHGLCGTTAQIIAIDDNNSYPGSTTVLISSVTVSEDGRSAVLVCPGCNISLPIQNY